MRLRVTSLALMCCLVTGAALAQAPGRSCVRVEVSSGSTAVPRPDSTIMPSSPRFSVTKILDLTFTVLFPARIGGDHLVELRVFTPDAQLYRSLAMPFASGGQANATRSVDGYAHAGGPRPGPLRGSVDDLPGRRHRHRVLGAVRPLAGRGLPRRRRAALRPGRLVHPRPLTSDRTQKRTGRGWGAGARLAHRLRLHSRSRPARQRCRSAATA